MSEQWKRLGQAVEARRLSAALDFATQETLVALAGVTRRTLTRLENGHPSSSRTLARVEAALRWAPGSARAILNGGEPTPLDTPSDAFTDPDEAAIWALTTINPATRLRLIDQLRTDRMHDLNRRSG